MQKQHEIMIHYLDGSQGVCISTGNNAAWNCKCERELPLIGYSDEIGSKRESSKIECPNCKRIYRVVAPGLKKVPTHVEQLNE